MPRLNGSPFFTGGIGQTVLLRMQPRLGEFPEAERQDMLARAGETRFDLIEWIGVLGGVTLVTWLLRFDPAQAASLPLPLLYLAQFIAAAPLLLLLVGPFYVRCTLRGLDLEIERRRRAQSSGLRR